MHKYIILLWYQQRIIIVKYKYKVQQQMMHNGQSDNQMQANFGRQTKVGASDWSRPRRGSYCQYKQQKINATLTSFEDKPPKTNYASKFNNGLTTARRSSVSFYHPPPSYMETKTYDAEADVLSNNYVKQKYARDEYGQQSKPSTPNLARQSCKYDSYEPLYQNKTGMKSFDFTNQYSRGGEKIQYRPVVGTIKSSSNKKKAMQTEFSYTGGVSELSLQRNSKYDYRDELYSEPTNKYQSMGRPQQKQDEFMEQYMDKYNKYAKNQNIQQNIKYGQQRRYEPAYSTQIYEQNYRPPAQPTNPPKQYLSTQNKQYYQPNQTLYRPSDNHNKLTSQKSCEFSNFYKQVEDRNYHHRFTTDSETIPEAYSKQFYQPSKLPKANQQQKYYGRALNVTPPKGKQTTQQIYRYEQDPMNTKREQLISKSKVLREKLNELSADKKLITSASKSGKQFSIQMKTESQQERLERLKNTRERIYSSPFKEGNSFSNNLKAKGQQRYNENNEKPQNNLKYRQNYYRQAPSANETMTQLKLMTKQRVPKQENKFGQERSTLSRQQSESINRINVLNSKINEKINSIICSYGK